MDELRIQSVQELRDIIDTFQYGGWAFRGQSDASWSLEPSITRFTSKLSIIRAGYNPLLGSQKLEWREKMRSLELAIFKEYAQSNHPQKELTEDEDLLDVLVELQHYGAPTRLLDFTLKPYIALFFSVYEGVGDFAIFCLCLEGLDTINECNETLVKRLWGEDGANRPNIYFYRPKYRNERIELQHGAFVIPSTLVLPFEILVDKTNANIKKYVISGRLRREVVIMLSKMNISPKSIYPEKDGVIKSFAWEATAKVLS